MATKTTQGREYHATPNECKMCFTLFWALWMVASLFFICVAFPLQLATKIKLLAINEMIADFLIISVNIACSVPLVSYIFLPMMVKLLRFWIFDTLIDVTSLKESHANNGNTIIELCPSKRMNVPQKPTFLSNILKHGLFPMPDYVFTDSEHYSPIPNKWKHTFVITITIIVVEYALWMSLYQQVFRHFEITNITDKRSMDLRVRNSMFLFFDFCVSVPILFYVVNPFIINTLLPRWMYRKVDSKHENCCIRFMKWIFCVLRSGIPCLEDIESNEIIDHYWRNRTKQLTEVVTQVMNVEANIDCKFTSHSGFVDTKLMIG
eukprot:231032_1